MINDISFGQHFFKQFNHRIEIYFKPNIDQPTLPDFYDVNDSCMRTFIDSFDMNESKIDFSLRNLDQFEILAKGDKGKAQKHYNLNDKLIVAKCAAESILKKLNKYGLLQETSFSFYSILNDDISFNLPLQNKFTQLPSKVIPEIFDEYDLKLISTSNIADKKLDAINRCIANIDKNILSIELHNIKHEEKLQIKAFLEALLGNSNMSPDHLEVTRPSV